MEKIYLLQDNAIGTIAIMTLICFFSGFLFKKERQKEMERDPKPSSTRVNAAVGITLIVIICITMFMFPRSSGEVITIVTLMNALLVAIAYVWRPKKTMIAIIIATGTTIGIGVDVGMASGKWLLTVLFVASTFLGIFCGCLYETRKAKKLATT